MASAGRYLTRSDTRRTAIAQMLVQERRVPSVRAEDRVCHVAEEGNEADNEVEDDVHHHARFDGRREFGLGG